MVEFIGKVLLRFIPIHLFRKKIVFMYEKEWSGYKFKSIGAPVSVTGPFIIDNPQCISIGNNFIALYNLRIEAIKQYKSQRFSPEVIIGDNVEINTNCHIGCINKVTIGNNVLLASGVYISDHSHGDITLDALQVAPAARPLISKGPVVIEDNVWVGEGVCIFPGVTIGKNSIIGANSVVTKSCPPNSVIAGVPAKIIKSL